MRISDWSSDVCSSDLGQPLFLDVVAPGLRTALRRARGLRRALQRREGLEPLREPRGAPVNHPSFQFGDAERERRAGTMAEQIPMPPGDLSSNQPGPYHNAMASANGPRHTPLRPTL